MDPGTQGAAHWSGFTGVALKVAELLVKLIFKEEAVKSIVGDGLNSGEEFKHLVDDMCKNFFQSFRKSGADQKGVVVSTVAKFSLKLLVWVLQHIMCIYRTIDIDTIDIEWCRDMNDHNKLKDDWPKALSEMDYPKANLGDVPQTFEYIIALLRKICGPLGIFLEYCIREILVPLAYEDYIKIKPPRMRR